MGEDKAKKLNYLINILTIAIIFILFFAPFVISNDAVIYYIGIALRVIMGYGFNNVQKPI